MAVGMDVVGKIFIGANMKNWCIGFVAVSLLATQATYAGRIDEALRKARDLGRPILALATSDHCAPCQKMKQTLRGKGMQKVLRNCVVLSMDSKSPEFQDWASRFPADTSMVPMVYVILPDGTQMYSQGGMLGKDVISSLLTEAISYASATRQSSEVALYRRQLDAAKQKSRKRKLITAINLTAKIAQRPGDYPVLQESREYHEKLLEAARQWLQDLDHQMLSEETAHGAAFRIAQIFVELKDYSDIHGMARQLLITYDQKEETRAAVAQAKHLLKARYRQSDKNCKKAIESYQTVVDLDPDSTSGRFAAKQLKVLRRKLAQKLTALDR